MNKNTITVQVMSFQELVNKYRHFHVPHFQRAYSWNKEQWSQLWVDLIDEAADGQEHFIGNIVLCKSDSHSGWVEIVDGQQRVTTMSILIAVLRNHLWDLNRFTDSHSLNETFLMYAGFGSAPKGRLHLSKQDQNWFSEFVHCNLRDIDNGDDFAHPKKSVPKGIPQSNRKLWMAYNFFRDCVVKEIGDDLQKMNTLMNYLADRVLFTATHLEDGADAYDLFECLNDRGLPLSVSDLFKNFLLSQASKNTAENAPDLEGAWNGMVDILDEKYLGDFFRYHWLSTRAKIQKKQLYREMRKAVTQNQLELEPYVMELKSEAVNFKDIIGEGMPAEAATESVLQELRDLGYKVVNSLLLAGWAQGSRVDRHKLTLTLDTFLVRYATFAGQVTNILEPRFSQLSIRLRDGSPLSDLVKDLEDLSPSDEQVWLGFRESNFNAKSAGVILRRIERELGAAPSDLENLVAVKIVPGKPSELGEMTGVSDCEGLASRDGRISNYALLPKSLKKEFELCNRGDQRLQMLAKTALPTQSSLNTGSVSPSLLDERRDVLTGHAKGIWSWAALG
jgi:hypothetical protein